MKKKKFSNFQGIYSSGMDVHARIFFFHAHVILLSAVGVKKERKSEWEIKNNFHAIKLSSYILLSPPSSISIAFSAFTTCLLFSINIYALET